MLKILLRLLAIGGFIYLSQDNSFLWWFNSNINTAHMRDILYSLAFVVSVFCFYVFDVIYLDKLLIEAGEADKKGQHVLPYLMKFIFLAFPFVLVPFSLSYTYFVVMPVLKLFQCYAGFIVVTMWFFSFLLLFSFYYYLKHSEGGKEIICSVNHLNRYHKLWFFLMQLSLGLFALSEFFQDIIFHFLLLY